MILNARPLVVAHRGSSPGLAEHTAAAYRQAVDEGADGVECDVRMTRDGHLVCIHDPRLDRTSNGRGRVTSARLEELAELDFGERFDDQVDPSATGILTLDQLITSLSQVERPIHLLIEAKHPSRYGTRVEQQLVELLDQHGLTTPPGAGEPGLSVTVMSFSPLALRHVHRLAPAIPTVFLFDLALPTVRSGRAPFKAAALGPGVNTLLAYPDVVERAHQRGHRVYAWTVNEASDIDRVAELGVDAIISDHPALVRSRLARLGWQ